MRFRSVIALVACLLAASVGAREASPRTLGNMQVAVESITWAQSDPECRDSGPCLLVAVRVSASTRTERARIKQATVVDVQGRRFDAQREAPRTLRPGTAHFAFALPEHAAVVTLELDGASFEIAHAGRLQDGPMDFGR